MVSQSVRGAIIKSRVLTLVMSPEQLLVVFSKKPCQPGISIFFKDLFNNPNYFVSRWNIFIIIEYSKGALDHVATDVVAMRGEEVDKTSPNSVGQFAYKQPVITRFLFG